MKLEISAVKRHGRTWSRKMNSIVNKLWHTVIKLKSNVKHTINFWQSPNKESSMQILSSVRTSKSNEITTRSKLQTFSRSRSFNYIRNDRVSCLSVINFRYRILISSASTLPSNVTLKSIASGLSRTWAVGLRVELKHSSSACKTCKTCFTSTSSRQMLIPLLTHQHKLDLWP